jgi:hypothetical protein
MRVTLHQDGLRVIGDTLLVLLNGSSNTVNFKLPAHPMHRWYTHFLAPSSLRK